MMLDQYHRIQNAAGIAIELLADGQTSVSATDLAVEKNKIRFERKVVRASSVEEALRKVPSSSAIALNFVGKGVLIRKLPLVEDIDQAVLAKILPNSNIEDYFIQHFQTIEWSFICLVRRSEAEKWLSIIRKLGYQVLALSLGPFTVYNIADQVNNYGEELLFDGHRIVRNQEMLWTEYQFAPGNRSAFQVKVDSETLDEALLIPYAATFQLLLYDKIDLIVAGVPELSLLLENTIKRNKLRVGGFIILVIFFILLAGNMIWLSALTASNERLAVDVSRQTISNTDAQRIEENIKVREHLLATAGWEGPIRRSNFISEAAQMLPDGVVWTVVSINPFDNASSRALRRSEFNSRTIKIEGFSGNISPVNEWIARLRTKKWLKDIQLLGYAFDNEKNTGRFVIIIHYQ